MEISAELRQSFGHVFAAVAETDVTRLVVNGAREKQDTAIVYYLFAKSVNIAIRLELNEPDGAGVGPDP